MTDRVHRDVLRAEFERTASTFAERTAGRFDDLDVVSFSGVEQGEVVVEVGAGTGNFLALFEEQAAGLVAVDLTEGMLREARRRFPRMIAVMADGASLPLTSGSVDLVSCAQMLHHVWEPLALLKEMRRVVKANGHVLVVDQVATERYEEAVMMNRLEIIRDPSHASCRPPSAMRTLVRATGLEILDEKISESTQTMSDWMGTGEFPPERFEAVTRFIEEHGSETGMDFRYEEGRWAFTRRRMMLLAQR
ncbi:MAG: class I SAM-dependent methyltransferase [Actinomycetota bacterium]